MSKQTEESIIPHENIDRLFHSPGRTAIMAAVCASGKSGTTFSELKQSCNLTDGNLNAHLTALQGAGAVRMKKEFVDLKPRSTIFATKTGLDGFASYLAALNEVLKSAKAALKAPVKRSLLAVRKATV